MCKGLGFIWAKVGIGVISEPSSSGAVHSSNFGNVSSKFRVFKGNFSRVFRIENVI
jgi:hypothetical protein